MLPPHDVYYDDQCEVCQAGVSWLRVLDRRGVVRPLPLSTFSLPPSMRIDDCLRELHVVDPSGRVRAGWPAVAALARLFPPTWLIGAIGAVPPFSWLGSVLYRWVARNRYAVSRCRGGVCRSAAPAEVRRRSSMGAFWSCRLTGFAMRLPLVAGAWAAGIARNTGAHARLFRRRIPLLDGRLTLLFLGGPTADLVPLLFGERFLAIVYDGVAIDPGSTKMRASLRRHLDSAPVAVHTVTATHHHEEHSGNLEWLAARFGARLVLSPATVAELRSLRLPFMRDFVIGQPAAVAGRWEPLDTSVATTHGALEVIASPGHCDDHASFYDPREKILFAGDAFMGSYFATPNPDVDSLAWIDTLERMAARDVEILVEGHGHIRTLRADIPDIPGVVTREDPVDALRSKLAFLRWVRGQVDIGRREGMPPAAIVATCFPWGRRWGWERYGADLAARLLSGGEFSRRELVRSFERPEPGAALPQVWEMMLSETTPGRGSRGR